MFDTEKFIIEMQTRYSLWNVKTPEYSDKFFKRKMWEEVAEVMFDGYENLTNRKKSEAVLQLQKKWKHLRDYYVREKKREKKKADGTVLKKRNTPLLNLLNFLSSAKTSKRPACDESPEEDRYYPVEEKFLPSKQTFSSPESTEEDTIEFSNFENHMQIKNDELGEESPFRSKDGMRGSFQECVLHSVQKDTGQENNPNMNFLLSILPEMNSMTERQVFEFKLEVMNVIKKIKYDS